MFIKEKKILRGNKTFTVLLPRKILLLRIFPRFSFILSADVTGSLSIVFSAVKRGLWKSPKVSFKVWFQLSMASQINLFRFIVAAQRQRHVAGAENSC